MKLTPDVEREDRPGIMRFRCTRCHMACQATEEEWMEAGSPEKVPCPGCMGTSRKVQSAMRGVAKCNAQPKRKA